MKKSTIAMIIMYVAYGTVFLIVGSELDSSSLSGFLFIAVMLILFFLVIFSKGIDNWLKSLDEKD